MHTENKNKNNRGTTRRGFPLLNVGGLFLSFFPLALALSSTRVYDMTGAFATKIGSFGLYKKGGKVYKNRQNETKRAVSSIYLLYAM